MRCTEPAEVYCGPPFAPETSLDRVGSPTWLPDGQTLGFVGLDGIYTLDLGKVFADDIYQGECPQIQ